MNGALVNALGAGLADLRREDDDAVLIGFGTHAGNHDTPNGSVTATVRQDGEEATSEAVHLHDAILMARAKVRRQIEAKRKAAEDAKREKAA